MNEKRIRTGRRLMGLVLFFLMSLCFTNVYAADNKSSEQGRKIRVGYYNSPRFSEGGEDGSPRFGYAYEYLQKIAAITGWEYEYVYDEWDSLLRKLVSGDIDFLAGISSTEERAKIMLFPKFSMGNESYYIFAHEDQPFVTGSVESFSGKTIGCTRNSMQYYYFKKWNEEHNKLCNIITYSGNYAMYNDFEKGILDAVVDSDNAVFNGSELVPILKVGDSEYYLAVTRHKPELLEELNVCLEAIQYEEPYYVETLHNKYYSETVVRTMFSEREEDWLRANQVIRIGYESNFLAYCDHDSESDSVIGGLKVFFDFSNEVLSKYGTQLVPVVYSSIGESLEGLSSGEVEAVFPMYHNLYESERSGIFTTEGIISSPMTAIVWDSQKFDESAENVVAVVDGFKDIEWYINDQYPQWKIVHYDSFEHCVGAVKRGEANCVVESTFVYKNLFDTSQYNNVALSKTADVSFALDRDNLMLLSVMNKLCRMLPNSVVYSAVSQYSNPEIETSFLDYIKEHFVIFGLGLTTVLFILFAIMMIARRSERKAKQAERQMIMLNERLKQNQEDLKVALDDARAANAAKTAFFSRMSHDIRTPLNGIIGLIDINEKHADDRELIDENRAKAKVAANHLLSLISDVLNLSKMESENVTLANEPFNVYELLMDVITIIKMRALEDGISVIAETTIDQIRYPYVYGSPLHIRQILINLFSNAIKYNKPGGSIFYRAERESSDDENVVYSFKLSDTGIGMSEEFLKHLFEPFSQEHNDARSTYQGTGLGMAIVKSLVEKMNGTIEVSSKVNVGTTFVVTIPFKLATAEDMPKKKDESKADLTGVRVLLVEDNELNMEIAEALLVDLGMVVSKAENGKVALSMFTDNPSGTYDLIIMDLMMPEMDGYEATKAIRASQRSDGKSIPIVAMSANAFQEDVQKCIESGMDGHIAKPINIDNLKSSLAEVLAVRREN